MEMIKTPEKNYVVIKNKRKEWHVKWYKEKVENSFFLGTYPSKIVALGAIAIDVDQYTRANKENI